MEYPSAMPRRLTSLLVPLVTFAMPAATLKHPSRDWGTYPAIVEFDAAADIFDVGDIHSDYDRLVTLLAGARIISGLPRSPDASAGPLVRPCSYLPAISSTRPEKRPTSRQIMACRLMENAAGFSQHAPFTRPSQTH
jgi:hypothetical protein